jgi:hypothetical protein
MLEACVHVTKTVFSESSSSRSEASSLGFSFDFGTHHFITRLDRFARSTQEAMLASWSIFERISSEPVGKENA